MATDFLSKRMLDRIETGKRNDCQNWQNTWLKRQMPWQLNKTWSLIAHGNIPVAYWKHGIEKINDVHQGFKALKCIVKKAAGWLLFEKVNENFGKNCNNCKKTLHNIGRFLSWIATMRTARETSCRLALRKRTWNCSLHSRCWIQWARSFPVPGIVNKNFRWVSAYYIFPLRGNVCSQIWQWKWTHGHRHKRMFDSRMLLQFWCIVVLAKKLIVYPNEPFKLQSEAENFSRKTSLEI